MTHKAQATKENDKWDFIKIENFFQRTPLKGEKTTQRMGANFCKTPIGSGASI